MPVAPVRIPRGVMDEGLDDEAERLVNEHRPGWNSRLGDEW